MKKPQIKNVFLNINSTLLSVGQYYKTPKNKLKYGQLFQNHIIVMNASRIIARKQDKSMNDILKRIYSQVKKKISHD